METRAHICAATRFPVKTAGTLFFTFSAASLQTGGEETLPRGEFAALGFTEPYRSGPVTLLSASILHQESER